MREPMNVTATAERSGGWWAVEVPEIPGLFTQARRLDQIDAMVRDAAGMLGREVGTVTVEPRLSEQDERMLAELLDARRQASEAQSHASSLTRATVDALRAQGMTVRDVADIIGVTPQRVSTIANA
ncbi:transcriptional regulator [Bifidobacterium moukalabense]|uniref:Phage transcriptional regulator n=1 Tax=Bifidobacterium moukalabense DSM 27321 TaxID=1435051 RepID=W4N9R6_9BIFI|nr:transcriptional regulator [Bifidobacterium moukalabense]ETY71380.1 Phage transcriptional regulator [Bifidobacterium moukalabense DSM 27321]